MILARRAWVVVAVVLALWATGSATPNGIAYADSAAVSESDLTYFYKNPSAERLSQLIRYMNGVVQPGNPGVQPPFIGFLAAALRRYPSDLDTIIPDGLSSTMQGIVATSLRLAGQDAKAQSLVDHLKASGAATPDLRYVPTSLDVVQATGPSEFDMFWGASFATGDPCYPMKILEHFAAVADVDGNADDMVAIARTIGTSADLKWVVQKRGVDKGRELLTQSSALWALISNALQHDFVRVAIVNYIKSHPAEPAAQALTSLAQAYRHYDVTKVLALRNDPPKPSATVNLPYLDQILDDLGRHAGTYPVHFEFADDQQRARSDISTIAGLLDPLFANFSQNAPVLLRVARLHTIGFNLDAEGSFEKADAAFSALMQLTPDDPAANFADGAFLAATTRQGQGIPYLEKAKKAGVVGADYWLGWSYVTLRNKSKAVAELETYTKNVPSDENAARILDAVRHDKIKFEEKKPAT